MKFQFPEREGADLMVYLSVLKALSQAESAGATVGPGLAYAGETGTARPSKRKGSS